MTIKTLALTIVAAAGMMPAPAAAELRLGIVGTDTSHVTAFTALLNDPASPAHVPGARVVAAYKGGSPDFPQSRDRIEAFTRELQDKWGVQIVGTIRELCERVDGVLLESVDGRVHLAQAREIFAARKPVFIDKPLATTLDDARAIAALAREAGVPWFSASSQRYSGVAALRTSDLEGAETWGPAPFAEHHQLDLSWYGIHAIEMLYAVLGPGCQEVWRVSSADTDVIVGRWKDGRIGTVRGLRPSSTYGAIAFRKDAKSQKAEIGESRSSYAPLVRDIVRFFETRTPPVSNAETLEVFSFLDAAQRSKEAHGQAMSLR